VVAPAPTGSRTIGIFRLRAASAALNIARTQAGLRVPMLMTRAEAMAVMGIAGEIAFAKSTGPGSLQLHFIDALYNLSADDIGRLLK